MKAQNTPTAQRSPTHSDQRASSRPSILETWQDLVAPDEIIEAGRRLGVIKRQRKLDLPALVEATIAAMTAVPGAETTALSYYLGLVSHTMAPSSFYAGATWILLSYHAQGGCDSRLVAGHVR